MGPFASCAAVLIDPTQKLLLVADNMNRAQEAQDRLARVGIRNVMGYTLADKREWQQQKQLKLATLSIFRHEDIYSAWQRGHSLQLVDVRSWAEWLKGHLPGAISMPLLELSSKSRSIDSSRLSLVYSEAGYRATTAASILLPRQPGDVGILIDGMKDWRSDNMPGKALEGSSSATLLPPSR